MDSRYGGHDYSELIYRTVFLFYNPNMISVRDLELFGGFSVATATL